MLKLLADNYLWFLIFILVLNMTQRKYAHTQKKRIATIYLATLLMVFNILVVVILTKELNHYLAWPAFGLILIIGYVFRDRAWPFKMHCVKCGKKLDFDHIFGCDDNLCVDCLDEKYPEEAEKRKEKEAKKAKKNVIEEEPFICPDTVEEIDWDIWEAEEHCVLSYVIKDGKILLIDKKQGMGTGLVNGPGGHIELEETAIEAAYREFNEETGLTASNLEYRGKLRFQFKGGVSMIGLVYFGTEAEGELKSSEETTPFWCDVKEMPYDKMWEDDKLWLPRAIEGEKFDGVFIFDDETMLSQKITFEKDEDK
jgi:8-oxo-dGTP diphosphatase